MKALSVQQPFAFEIMSGKKTIEVRDWDTLHRGDLLICSSKKPAFPREEMEEIEDEYGCTLFYGQALCIVQLADVRLMRRGDEERALVHEIDPESYAWVLEDLRPVIPFPVKGKEGLFDVDDALITLSPFKYYEPVVIKSGTLAQGFGIDFSGWHGRATDIYTTEDGEHRLRVVWDSLSLRSMPISLIERCEREGVDWSGALLRINEVEHSDARDSLDDVDDTIDRIIEENPSIFPEHLE